MSTNMMTLPLLRRIGACYDATDWFRRRFPKERARTSTVLRAVVKDNEVGWARWYIRNVSGAKHARLLVKFIHPMVEDAIRAAFSSDKEKLQAYLGYRRQIKKGLDFYAVDVPNLTANLTETRCYNLLKSYADAISYARLRFYRNAAGECVWTAQRAESFLNDGKYTQTNKVIALFDSIPPRVRNN